MQGTLARKLRVLRAERGLTLREAAKLADVRPGTLSELERGRRHPHDLTLSRIAKAYGVPVEELLEEPVAVPKAEPPQVDEAELSGEEIAEIMAGLSEEEFAELMRGIDWKPSKVTGDPRYVADTIYSVFLDVGLIEELAARETRKVMVTLAKSA